MSKDKAAQTVAPLESDWLSRWTTLADFERSIVDNPSRGLEAWARTTAGAVAVLLALQLVTGLLLAFYYVPSAESAHTTVVYIEKVLPAGSWLRALHHYGSQWLTLALALHLAQLFWRASYRRRPVGWLASVALLALVLGAGATGYSLPWDARAFFGTRVTEGVASGLPFVGHAARKWLLGSNEISAVTLVRFFALHVLVIPPLIFLIVMARFFVLRRRAPLPSDSEERRLASFVTRQLMRNAITAGVVFVALSAYAWFHYAPLGPAADTAAPGYLPRPGAQFLWLFQMLKYLPGRLGSVVAVGLPGLILLALGSLPFLKHRPLSRLFVHPRRDIGFALFALGFALFTTLTILAYVKDATDPNVRAQLARQRAEEDAFRAAPFTPLRTRASESGIDDTPDDADAQTRGSADTANANASPSPSANASPATPSSSPNANSTPSANSSTAPPDAYVTQCSACHGTRGQGASPFPRLIGVSAKPRRTVEDIISLLNNPEAYGIQPPMKSYADKLTEEEKRAIAEWVVSLKKR
jgi:ubiquinol-cytochrome c reductase cytochrome b subunit